MPAILEAQNAVSPTAIELSAAKSVPFAEEVKTVLEILEAEGIPYKVESTRPSMDITFTNATIIEYIIKVRPSDEQKAIDVLEGMLAEIDTEEQHYMDAFADKELLEVISSPKEWSKHDLEYAKKLAKQRGLDLNTANLSEARHAVIIEQVEATKAKASIIFIGYLSSLAGGWLGLVVAMHLKYKTQQIEGEAKVPYYDKAGRKDGDNMLVIFFFWLVFYSFYFSV